MGNIVKMREKHAQEVKKAQDKAVAADPEQQVIPPPGPQGSPGWPNVGQIVWSDPSQGRYGTYKERKADPPKAWRVMKENHTHVHLSAVEKKRGQVFAETTRVDKRDQREVELYHLSERSVWQSRIQAARTEVKNAKERLASEEKEVRDARGRLQRALIELDKTLKKSKAK